MKNLILAFLLVVASTAASHAQTTKATVRAVTGDAYVLLPGSTTPTPLKEGQTIPTGSVITTKAASQVTLSPFPGAAAVIQENTEVSVDKLNYQTTGSEVDKRAADLGLHVGTVVFALDGKNKNVTDFKIHTGGAVAAARGTSGSVSVPHNSRFCYNIICSGGSILVKKNAGGTFSVVAVHKSKCGAPTVPATQEDMDALLGLVVDLVNKGVLPFGAITEITNAMTADGLTIPPGTPTTPPNPDTTTTTGAANPANTVTQPTQSANQ